MLILWNEMRSVWQARALVRVLARREVAARHAGTAAGLAWPYLQPLLTVAAYYLVFDVVFRMRMGEGLQSQKLGTFLIVGALAWMAFCDALTRGMNSLLDAGGLLHKNPLPPVLFVVRSVLASGIIFLPLMLCMAGIYAMARGWGLALWALLPLLLLQWVLSLLLAYLLAVLAAALRDTVQFVGFALSVGIYLSPILFPLQMFPENWRWVLWLNPMTGPVLGYQSVLLQGVWPEAAVWWAGLTWLGVASIVLTVVVGRSRDQLVDWL